MKAHLSLVCAAFLFLSACTSSETPVAQKDQGRPETKKLEAATAAGYDGKAVRNSVDNTLNKNDDRTKEVDKQGGETK